jgi:hypothetical protein
MMRWRCRLVGRLELKSDNRSEATRAKGEVRADWVDTAEMATASEMDSGCMATRRLLSSFEVWLKMDGGWRMADRQPCLGSELDGSVRCRCVGVGYVGSKCCVSEVEHDATSGDTTNGSRASEVARGGQPECPGVPLYP